MLTHWIGQVTRPLFNKPNTLYNCKVKKLKVEKWKLNGFDLVQNKRIVQDNLSNDFAALKHATLAGFKALFTWAQISTEKST